MLGHSLNTVEENIRYFADFAKQSNEEEKLQENASNASKILEDRVLNLVANLLNNPPVTFSDDCRM